MMKLFCVRDVKGDSFSAPMAAGTRLLMIRSFTEECNRKGSEFGKYPEDYSLYEIADFEPNSALIKPYSLPQLVTTASQVMVRVVHNPELFPAEVA